MTYAAASSTYREMEVLSATPGRLVVIVYDYLLVHLKRASIAIDTGNLELRGESLGRAQLAVAELMGGLNMERGGDMSRQLASLYTFFLSSLVDVGRKNDAKLLARITQQAMELRSAFAEISVTQAASAA
jgi:flagellar protein FliS